MRTYTYIGYFGEGISPISVSCMGFFQAYILITAQAIHKALDYRSLHRIVNGDTGAEELVNQDIIPFKNI